MRWGIVSPLLADDETILDEFLESSEQFQVGFDEIRQRFEYKWPRNELKNGLIFKSDDRWLYWGVIDDFMRALGFTTSDVEQFFSPASQVGAFREVGNYVMSKERHSKILVFEKVNIEDLDVVWRINVPRKWKEKKIEIRGWRVGDKIRVEAIGRLITKKISDVFVELKWNRLQKQRCRLLVVEGEIMALEGAQKAAVLEKCEEPMFEIAVHGKNIG